MYFSRKEMWVMTKMKGIRNVIRVFVVDTVLLTLYTIIFMAAASESLAFAVKGSSSDDTTTTTTAPSTSTTATKRPPPPPPPPEDLKAQSGAQAFVTLVMLYSLLLFFQLGRVKGMVSVEREDPAEVSWQVRRRR